MPSPTITSQAHADDMDAAVKLAREALGALEYAAMLFDRAAEINKRFVGASAIVRDAAADIEPAEQELTQAILEWDAAQAYGERPRYAALVHGGSI